MYAKVNVKINEKFNVRTALSIDMYGTVPKKNRKRGDGLKNE